MQNKPTLPEKMKMVMDYMMQGHDLEAEGRKFVLVTDGRHWQFGARAEVIRFDLNADGPVQTIIGLGMSFTHFLSIVDSLTDGDMIRIKQILELKGEKG